MKTIRSLKELDDCNIGLTIGNFDGVHRGHQDLLNLIKKDCENKNRKFLVVTFVPHPLTILKNEKHFLINAYDERKNLLEKRGVDYLLEINFTRDFSNQDPEDFLNNFILGKGVHGIYLGHDFAFGANKKGDFEFVKSHCEKKKIEVFLLDEFIIGEMKISSTAIRNALGKADISKANEILGRNYFLSGRIVKGAGRGKQIGFPTANIELDYDRLIPPRGVYATTVTYNQGRYKSLTNIGFNPTFSGDEILNIETHILDFSRDIYGELLQIDFLEKVRGEQKFPSVNDLVSQIKNDVEIRRVLTI